MTKTILVIEDERDISEPVRMRLEYEGYKVTTAYDGLDGLDKAKKIKPDLVLLDLFMPIMDGYEVCRKLKELEGLKSVPIIFFSAVHEHIKEAKDAGGVDFITKPFDLAELINKINFYIKKS
ncbi:MAG: response regulator [Candidatus Omnitrophota bacterium]|nr:response regulator [Candidatus Omnitrophota bacterium]